MSNGHPDRMGYIIGLGYVVAEMVESMPPEDVERLYGRFLQLHDRLVAAEAEGRPDRISAVPEVWQDMIRVVATMRDVAGTALLKSRATPRPEPQEGAETPATTTPQQEQQLTPFWKKPVKGVPFWLVILNVGTAIWKAVKGWFGGG